MWQVPQTRNLKDKQFLFQRLKIKWSQNYFLLCWWKNNLKKTSERVSFFSPWESIFYQYYIFCYKPKNWWKKNLISRKLNFSITWFFFSGSVFKNVETKTRYVFYPINLWRIYKVKYIVILTDLTLLRKCFEKSKIFYWAKTSLKFCR